MRRMTLAALACLGLGWGWQLWAAQQSPFDTAHLQPLSSQGRVMLASVAHAGGVVDGQALTNSLQALDANRDRHDLFEIDFQLTADGHPICLHDWDDAFVARFGHRPDQPPTLAAFERLLQDGGLQNCTLDTLADWLRRNPGKTVITDFKTDNLVGLALIAQALPDLRDRFMPQAYQPDEIARIKALGFDRVLWTLYRFDGPISDVPRHLAQNPVVALVMPKRLALAGLAQVVEQATGVQSYVHTVNSAAEAGCFADLGLAGIYTDRLGGEFPADRPGEACRSLDL